MFAGELTCTRECMNESTCVRVCPSYLVLQQQFQVPLCGLDGLLGQFGVHLGTEGHHLLRHLNTAGQHTQAGKTA